MVKKLLILTALLAAPSLAQAQRVVVRTPAIRTQTAAFAAVNAAYGAAGHSMGWGQAFNAQTIVPMMHMFYRPTMTSVFAANQRFIAMLKANVVARFFIPDADAATYEPEGEVAEAVRRLALNMPEHVNTTPESIRYIERNGSDIRPAYAGDIAIDDGAVLSDDSSYFGEGVTASDTHDQLVRMEDRMGILDKDRVDPSGVGRRVEGSASFDGSTHTDVVLN